MGMAYGLGILKSWGRVKLQGLTHKLLESRVPEVSRPREWKEREAAKGKEDGPRPGTQRVPGKQDKLRLFKHNHSNAKCS